jgi:hypothetical protein
MAPIYAPEIEQPVSPTTETLPERQKGGWSPRPHPRVGLNLGSDDDMLLIENRTTIPWSVYHRFHHLCVIDPNELLVFHLCKQGSLSARPLTTADAVEYLTVPLNYAVNQVYIYRRSMSQGIEVYDMRVLQSFNR